MVVEPEFDPYQLLVELDRYRVRHVVVGGVAARALGSPLVTVDLDVCYARDDQNHAALVEMLRAVHARLRGVEPGLPFRLDRKTIANGDSFTFETDLGPFDILGTPAGTTGYEDLVKGAVELDLDGFTVLVAGIDDLIRMKRAAGQPKDMRAVEELGALREELDAGR